MLQYFYILTQLSCFFGTSCITEIPHIDNNNCICLSHGKTENGECFNINDTACSGGLLGIGTGSIHDCCLVMEGGGNYRESSGVCNTCKSTVQVCLYISSVNTLRLGILFLVK